MSFIVGIKQHLSFWTTQETFGWKIFKVCSRQIWFSIAMCTVSVMQGLCTLTLTTVHINTISKKSLATNSTSTSMISSLFVVKKTYKCTTVVLFHLNGNLPFFVLCVVMMDFKVLHNIDTTLVVIVFHLLQKSMTDENINRQWKANALINGVGQNRH